MAESNEANDANFSELSGHCQVLSAKLAQMTSGAGSASVRTAIEDLEDYYGWLVPPAARVRRQPGLTLPLHTHARLPLPPPPQSGVSRCGSCTTPP